MTFRLAHADPGDDVPRIVELPLASGYAEDVGALLVKNGSAQWAACGADPSAVAAVANFAGGTDSSGFNILGKKEFPTGYGQGIPVGGGKVFRAQYVGTPAIGDYGVIRDTDGKWKVDFNETTAKVVRVTKLLTGAPESLPEVTCVFLSTVVAQV